MIGPGNDARHHEETPIMFQGLALIQLAQTRHADDLRAARSRHALGVTRLRRQRAASAAPAGKAA